MIPDAMHHCMIVHGIYPYDETRVQRQAQALVERGHAVDVICLRNGAEPNLECADGVTVYRLPVVRNKRRGVLGQFVEYLVFALLAFVEVTRLHLAHRYDVVQVHNLPDFLVFAALVPRLTGSRIILDLHDLMPEFYCAKFGTTMSSLPVRLVVWQEQVSCRIAHHVITVTEPWRQTLIRRGVPADKCTVVMNLADPRYFVPSSVSVTEPSTSLRLIYHGQITWRYGLDLLLQALVRVRASVPDVHLTVQGRGEFLETVQSLVQSLDLQSTVTVQSEFLSASDLAQLILAHDVGIVPYRRDIFTDGILPTKLMEYMALGRAVIAARTPVITAYCDENMVELFEPEDVDMLAERIVYLYHHPERRRELALNTHRFNQKYNWPSQRERYVNLAEKLGRVERTSDAVAT